MRGSLAMEIRSNLMDNSLKLQDNHGTIYNLQFKRNVTCYMNPKQMIYRYRYRYLDASPDLDLHNQTTHHGAHFESCNIIEILIFINV